MHKPIENSKYFSIMAWIGVSLFLLYQYILRVIPNLISDNIIENFHMNNTSYGQFLGIYYIVYTVTHIPISLLLTKIGAKNLSVICVLMTGFGFLPLVYSDSYILACIGRIISATGSSGSVILTFYTISRAFKQEKFALILGITVPIGIIGMMLAGTPMYVLIQKFGYVNTIAGVSLFSVILAIFLYVFSYSKTVEEDAISIKKELAMFLKYKDVVIFSIFGGFMIGILEGYSDGWATKFLHLKYPDISLSILSSVHSILFIGFIVGSPFLGWLASSKPDWCNKILSLIAILLAILFTVMLYSNMTILLLGIICFMLGFGSSYQALIIFKANICVPKEISNLSATISNMFMMVFGYVFHSLLGFISNIILERSEFGFFSLDVLQKSLLVIPIACMFSAIYFFYKKR